MATVHESSIEVIRSGIWEQESTRRDEELLNMNSVYSEETPLLLTPKLEHPTCFEYIGIKLKRLTFVKSKSAILILIWSFLAGVLHWAYTDPGSIITPLVILKYIHPDFLIVIIGSVYVYFAILQLFYPLAGYLADVRCGRYKCVVGSLWCFVGSSALVVVGGILTMFLLSRLDFLPDNDTHHSNWLSNGAFYATVAFLGPPVVVSIFLIFSNIVSFNANVIQFGLDQLHDAPTEHLVLFIHWYVVLSYAGTELIRASASTLTSVCPVVFESDNNNYYITILVLVVLLLLVSYVCLIISLCVASCKRRVWFLSDSSSRNPYGLVYRVICFARAHKTPIQRSAFTYCEEELPSRLDLGKTKYGGPFTTEQVEDVKVLLGILKVLLTLGPLFAVERSNNFLLPAFFAHLSQNNINSMYSCSVLSNNTLPSVVIIFLLILYIVLVRPFVTKYIPGILKRVGLGMVLMIIPTLCFFIIDTVYHKVSPTNPGCFLRSTEAVDDFLRSTKAVDFHPFLLIPLLASVTGSMIFYIAIYEFIYSQSPHSMKGLMFGTFFAIRGVFQLLGALMFIFPFLGWNTLTAFPSCGFVYFLINMIAALFGIIAYIWVSRKYQHRQRDEPDNVYRYVDEYYSKAQDEPNYDYDDYDNLNVHTIG